MKFISTHGQADPLSFSETVAAGLASDGGLFVPEQLPDISPYLSKWATLSYPELCFQFLRLFATDIPNLQTLINLSYRRFDAPDIAPIRQLDTHLYVLELFHGPTLTFKDFALQLLGNLYREQIRRTQLPINVIGATSGDTGSAAIYGLLNQTGTNVFILYPSGRRIAPLQERQMACTGADNVFPIAIDGTFDDAQQIVKSLLSDLDFKRRHGLCAINSINLARLLSQCVYYIYAWLYLPPKRRDDSTFIVPTGNFGNVLAGWWAQRMGVPIHAFKIATNQNDSLYHLFTTGRYQRQAVIPSYAPSMDIQVASNFERFLYAIEGCDSERVRHIIEQIQKTGTYMFRALNTHGITAVRVTDAAIVSTIRSVFETYDYLIDPHTACGFNALNSPSIVLATAHPAKFPDVIAKAVDMEATHPHLQALKDRPLRRYSLSADLEAVRDFIIFRSQNSSKRRDDSSQLVY